MSELSNYILHRKIQLFICITEGENPNNESLITNSGKECALTVMVVFGVRQSVGGFDIIMVTSQKH